MNITYTDYFLVGGFDKNKSKGLIKLFKLVYDETNYNKINYIKIQYMQDINFYNEYTQVINQNENNNRNEIIFKGFRKPISSIIQSKNISNNIGDILITCFDGNVYSFNCPNIDLYLKYDEQFNNNTF